MPGRSGVVDGGDLARQWVHADRNSGGSAHGRVQRCCGLDEAGESDGDDQ